ncbi:DUF885 domain-containing protein [Microbulbifer hainanensis]|uniref:DUF885 domain-containing protein n=1 Tax=Microbulbifer hainanensis TaxID=2735675 RepID=UPI001867EB2F|nr:DUF885 domain-containing protein [Microbulbifer hainanensis]
MDIKKFRLTLLAALFGSLLLAGCDQGQDKAANEPQVKAGEKSAQSQAGESASQTEAATSTGDPQVIAQANQLFEDQFQELLARSPEFETALGIKKNYGKWDDLSDEFSAETHQIKQRQLTELEKLDPAKLDAPTRLSLELAKDNLKMDIAGYKWRLYNYPVNQMFGTHSDVPSLLINQHRVDDVSDAQAYIARLNALPQHFDQLIAGIKERADKGIIAPKFVFPYVISDSKNLIRGAPFDDGEDSTLFADFKGKVDKLNIDAKQKEQLIADGKKALQESMQPAYESLIAYLGELQKQATTDDGAWKFPDGNDFYNFALKRTTTTDLTAEQIHEIGLKEVKRIHDEMRGIMKEVNFDGSLQDFFKFMRTDAQFYYPNTDEGRKRYLKEATAVIDDMKAHLDELFITKPKADLVVKAVEPYREKSAGKAFYERPAPDGSRPGIYYANLYNMKDMPTYQMEALAYHEGIPGHHMQISIAQELKDIPKFRKFGGYTAYVEGWGLYSELTPKEIGFYKDPYSDFGRLAMELWRAARLVVDTGIHHKKWTREQAIDWLSENTPNPKGDVVKAIERYIVMPSQATAYKIGMLKILELRKKAKNELGDQFDIRAFHDTILANGAVPLDVLEELVDKWIAEVKTQQA